MLDLYKKWLNVLSFVHSVLSYFRNCCQEIEKFTSLLMQRKATVMIFNEEKTSDESLRAKGARLMSPREYMIGRALRHNRAETCKFQSCVPKAMHM